MRYRGDAMATDIALILRRLEAFYAFDGKVVLHVGAGGGQFIGYAARAGRVVAVDPDPEAVDRLKGAVRDAHLTDRVHVLQADFFTVAQPARSSRGIGTWSYVWLSMKVKLERSEYRYCMKRTVDSTSSTWALSSRVRSKTFPFSRSRSLTWRVARRWAVFASQ